MRGRKPRPTIIKILEGEPNKDRINLNEPKAFGTPHCPSYLTPEAKAEWHRICPILKEMGLLAKSDRALIANYCQAYARMVKYEKLIAEKGELYKTQHGNITTSPAYWVLNKEREMVHKFAVELGLTPSARSRISVSAPESDDPLERLLTASKN